MKECSKWKSGKRFLTAAITLSLLGSLGLYSPAAYAEEDFEEYTGSITGKEDNASEYVMAHITKDGGKNYKFTDDSLIKTNQGVKVGDLDYPVNIDASGHVLKFYGHVNDKHTLVHAVEANSKKGVTITAKKLIIDAGNTKSRAEGISVGGQNGTNKDAPYRLTINGDTDIRAHGDTYGLGMYLCGNAEVTVNGNVTMNTHDEKNPWAVYVEKDGGLSYYGGSAIYAGNNYKLQLGPKLTINGLVDLKVNANGAFANGGHSDIYLRGGNIEINKDNTKGYYALLAECATTTMNMERDENKVPVRAGSAKVTIKGNIGASAGAINVNEPETYSRTNLGLATPDSSWTGIAYNAFKDEGNEVSGTLYGSDEIIKKTFFGEINLWLQNGASWTNEAWGEPPDAYYGEDFSESHLKRLVGGESADKAGHIFQKPGEDEDSEGINIRVDDYKGFTNVYYGHKDEKPTDILGGTFTVTKAQTGSGITLITDSKGLNVDSSKAADKNLASETLNALANKLFYTAYKNGETNLAGKVEIAEGLTSSSLSKRMEDITFKESNGQGQYLYTPASDIPEEQTETAFTDTITGVKAKDMKYVNTGVRKEDGTYKFTKDSEITVAAGGPAVKVEEDVIIRADGKTLKMKTVEGSGTVYGINQSTAKKAEITAKNLDVEVTSTSRAEGIHMANSNAAIRPEMTINGNVNLKVSGTANTLGAYIQGNSRLTVNGNVTADVDGHNGGFSYYGATGLYSTSNMGPNSMGADITVNGNVDLKGKAHGIFANAGGSKVTVNGGSIEVDKASTNPYAAIRAEDGIVNMNVKLDSNGNAVGSLDKKVNIKGNLAVTTGAVNEVDKKGTLSQINLGLTTSDSTLQGVVYNAFPDEGKKAGELTFKGEANLFLANGAAWMNEKYGDTGTSWGGKNFEGSHLTRLAGGVSADKAGQIFQKDTGNITVDNYSGYTDVYYAHEETAPKTMIGGDFIIRKAASGSGISLITDNKGLNTSSNASADKNLVSETLNALANKLFYKAYADGENNLTGFVKIAEGLTSSEAVLKTGNITFKKDNGQGQYLYETAYPNEQVTDPINKTIDGSTASEQVYKEAGVYKSDTDTYKFTKNPATVNGDSGAAVDAGAKDIHVDSGENTLNLNGGNTGVGVKAEGGKTADIKGNANITGKTGVVADGAGSKVLLSGNSNITAEGDGIVASGSGIVEAAGITNVTAGAGRKAVRAGAGSSVSLQSGKLKGDVEADGGTVFLREAKTEGNAAAAAGGSINLTDGSVSGAATADNGTIETENTNVVNGASALNGGKLKLRNGKISGGVKTDAGSAADVVMDRAGNALKGDVSGEGQTDITLSNGGNWDGNSAGSGKTQVKVGNGSTWTGTSMNSNTDVDLEGKWKQTGNGKVRKLISNNGVLDKTASESGNTDIGKLSGRLSLIYAHDKTNPTKVLGGSTFVATADAGSTVDMITDNAGLDTNSDKAADKNKVSEVLNAMAGKLQYTGYQNGERNLKGKLRIAEGLTSSSAGLKTEALSFKRDGRGYFDYTPAKPNKPEIETGDYETSIMSSTRSALTSSILVWRNDMNDMYKRMGDLRIGAESGLWARAYGGRISYDANNAYMKNSYWAAQVGIDKRLASGWHVGGAFGYNDGSATYRYGGKGDPKLYTLAAYATRVSEDGQYVDVIAKAGKLSNKFTAYNKYSAPALRNYVEGKYDTYGYGISAEYGKKIRMGKGFVTPQAELTWSRLSSDSFDAAAPSGESMRVNQSSVNSLIGRLGVVAGVESDKGNFYAKASLFHEFDGDGHILFSEPGKTGKRSSFSLKDTWAEIALGGNYYLSPRSMIYADFTKSFGGDYKVDWRINAGIRFSF